MYTSAEQLASGPGHEVFRGEREYDRPYISAAQKARLEQSDHYDKTLDSRVGVAMRVVDRFGREFMVTGGNYHEGVGTDNKRCAEGNALHKLQELRQQLGLVYEEELTITDIYVAATDNQARLEAINGLPIEDSAALDPCGGCRTYLSVYPGVRLATRVVSAVFDSEGEMTGVNVERFEDTLQKYSGTAPPIPSARPKYPVPAATVIGGLLTPGDPSLLLVDAQTG